MADNSQYSGDPSEWERGDFLPGDPNAPENNPDSPYNNKPGGMDEEEKRKLYLALNLLSGRMDFEHLSHDLIGLMGYDPYKIRELGPLDKSAIQFWCVETIVEAIEGAYKK